MLEKQIASGDNKRIKEEKIIIKTLRLLAEEHLITLEEEIIGTELFHKEIIN